MDDTFEGNNTLLSTCGCRRSGQSTVEARAAVADQLVGQTIAEARSSKEDMGLAAFTTVSFSLVVRGGEKGFRGGCAGAGSGESYG